LAGMEGPLRREVEAREEKTKMSEKPIVTLFMLASVALPVAAWLVIRWYLSPTAERRFLS
jgi:hypothetical protein